MSQPKLDLTINQNASFKFSFVLSLENNTPIDISNWQFRSSIKENVTDPDPPVLRFICVGTNSDLYDPNNPISLESASLSTVEIKLSADQTELLTQRRYVYDVIGVDTGETIPSTGSVDENNPVATAPIVYRVLQGKIMVDFGVTDRDPTQ